MSLHTGPVEVDKRNSGSKITGQQIRRIFVEGFLLHTNVCLFLFEAPNCKPFPNIEAKISIPPFGV